MAGKPGAKNNAITHGAYAENLILPGESIREFKLLHRGLIDEWKPLGALEEDTVLTLAQCIWLKRRVDRFYHREASWAQQHPAEEEISDVGRRAKLLENVRTLQDLNEVIADVPDLYKRWMDAAIPRSEFKDEKSWIDAIKSKILDMLVAQRLVVILQLESQEFKAVKAGEVRELTSKKIALDERLDARIDKALKRLAQLKTFKQALEDQASRTKTINARRITHQR
jgi:hypothetical protein